VPRVGEGAAAAAGDGIVSGYPPTSPAGRVVRGLRELLFDPAAVDESGGGLNLVQAMVQLAASIDRAAFEMQRYNDRRDREDGA
jgi:hypothetical protein